ncbi:MAG: hypothetical protein HQM14_07790 [SAR324 cluster bacterium]|nr:hypothetical protein [SAR324 cluster bacterium]
MINVSDAAKKLNISRAAVNKRIRKLGISKDVRGKFSFITETDFAQIEGLNADLPKNYQPRETHSTATGETSGTQSHLEEIIFLREQVKDAQHALDQEQQLHAAMVQRFQQLENKVELLENQPSEHVDSMISLLEKTRDAFIANMEIFRHKAQQSWKH